MDPDYIPALTETKCDMALAGDPRAQIEAIKTGTAKLAVAVRNGEIDKQIVVDAICEQAENIGLSDAVGIGTVHIAIAEGLKQVNGADAERRLNGEGASAEPDGIDSAPVTLNDCWHVSFPHSSHYWASCSPQQRARF